MKKAMPTEEAIKAAEEYVRKQLATMDGSAEAGIRRIGTDQFNDLVMTIAKLARKTEKA